MSEWTEWWPGEQRPRPDPARVARARAGLIEFCETEYPRVVRFLMIAGAPLEIAEEAAREAFAGWWAVLGPEPDRYWEERENRPAWARAVALRSRILSPARARTRPSAARDAGGPDADGAGTAREFLEALRSLEEEHRRVLAFTADGFTPAEIAQVLFMTEERARAIKDAACARLAQASAGPAVLLGDGERADQALRAAVSSLPPVSATVADVLTEIMTADSLRVPVRLTTAPAAEVIRARVHARRLALAAADGAVPARAISRSLAGPDPELNLATATEVARAVERARGHLLALGAGADLGVDLDHDEALATELLSVLARSDTFDLLRASDLAATLASDLLTARMNSLDMVRGLARLPADASGADLSGLDIGHLSPLDGVTWTRETTWPPGTATRIESHSEEVRPGTYKIHIPYTGV
jgi:DNA-directed RNA polymerase specialized sigma24 family protein